MAFSEMPHYYRAIIAQYTDVSVSVIAASISINRESNKKLTVCLLLLTH